jgi:hypothetical protein
MEEQKQDLDKQNNQEENLEDDSSIIIDVSPNLLHRIEVAAAKNGLSIGEYLAHILEQNVPDESATTARQRRRPITKESIERLMRTREEISRETNGRIFPDSAEILREEREKRTRYLMGETDVYDE